MRSTGALMLPVFIYCRGFQRNSIWNIRTGRSRYTWTA